MVCICRKCKPLLFWSGGLDKRFDKFLLARGNWEESEIKLRAAKIKQGDRTKLT